MQDVLCTPPPSPPARTAYPAATLSVRMPAGRRALRVRLREPGGVIRLYRIGAPRGVYVRAAVRVPGVTAPITLSTRARAPAAACWTSRERTVCEVQSEACPIPGATWRLLLVKPAGPAARVRLWFRVG